MNMKISSSCIHVCQKLDVVVPTSQCIIIIMLFYSFVAQSDEKILIKHDVSWFTVTCFNPLLHNYSCIYQNNN